LQGVARPFSGSAVIEIARKPKRRPLNDLVKQKDRLAAVSPKSGQMF